RTADRRRRNVRIRRLRRPDGRGTVAAQGARRGRAEMGHPMRVRARSRSGRGRALTALLAVLAAAAVAPAGAQAVVRLTPTRLSFTATGDVRLGDLTGDGRLDVVTVSAGGFH